MMVNLLFYASLLGDSFSPVKKVAKLEKNNHSGTYFMRTSLVSTTARENQNNKNNCSRYYKWLNFNKDLDFILQWLNITSYNKYKQRVAQNVSLTGNICFDNCSSTRSLVFLKHTIIYMQLTSDNNSLYWKHVLSTKIATASLYPVRGL